MASGFLRVEGEFVVGEDGRPVVLRGAAIGGWMNMENFITGYPGMESKHRAAMLKVLGKEKYEFFFDKFLEYFFGEEDAKFFASKGLNCIRVPFNHRHFEDDSNPRVLKEGGFKHLDRVIDICAKNGIYTILDMHTVPGGQNPDWHSDNPTNYAAFWDYKDHQDRTIWLWQQIAARYKDNPWVAGYNPINEPCDPEHWRLPAFYDRLEPAIRKVDPRHILWLDGNTFSMEWKFFENPLPNCVYALHDYTMYGFPKGSLFTGSQDEKNTLELQFLTKAEIMYRFKTPIWNGEFGPVYAQKGLDANVEKVNSARLNCLSAQLDIYDKYKCHWNIWLYKDIGFQGMVYADPESKYMKVCERWLAKKRRLQLDAWGRYPSQEVEEAVSPLVNYIDRADVCPESKNQYPPNWDTDRQITRLVNQIYMSNTLNEEFANLFKDMSFEELDECAKSFHFDNCMQREGLNRTLEEHAHPVCLGDRTPSALWRMGTL
ncbi:glycoside hydrolase [Delitschia confertaspora ATCC 74209]|uniref:Glycoside hydrolase n=1 Tax=Delitschia confertaspora ATCC 74209 TaxID=1513339 RepID=A0A9P4JPG8_9PLEO|nr:glycoside hydrolase [Delitschia confertaspora ATCC 74209]